MTPAGDRGARERRANGTSVCTVDGSTDAVLKQLRRLGPVESLDCCYEAGPTGYGLYRKLRQAGVNCIVVAPSPIPRKPGDRVKTDRRDARALAELLRSGLLTAVWVPDDATEAMRDLSRAREDAKAAERVARQHLGKFLLRHERRWSGKSNWTLAHMEWLERQKFAHEAQQRVLQDYLHQVKEAAARVLRLEADIAAQLETWSRAPVVKALQAFRGVRMVTAVGVVSEIGDFERFPSAPKFMSFLGLTPAESSSGDSTRRYRITRAGNAHLRRLLVEAAWAYRFQPRMSQAISKRNEAVSTEVRSIAWKAQRRLNDRYRRMLERGKTKQQTVTAVARELAGFIWAAARQEQGRDAGQVDRGERLYVLEAHQ